jgi:hypothetical protein
MGAKNGLSSSAARREWVHNNKSKVAKNALEEA